MELLKNFFVNITHGWDHLGWKSLTQTCDRKAGVCFAISFIAGHNGLHAWGVVLLYTKNAH